MNVTCSFPEQFLYRTEESRLLDLADVELIPADDKARDMFPFRKQSEPDAETLDQSQATQHVGGYRGQARDSFRADLFDPTEPPMVRSAHHVSDEPFELKLHVIQLRESFQSKRAAAARRFRRQSRSRPDRPLRELRRRRHAATQFAPDARRPRQRHARGPR